jgi:hypothetical protein
MSMMRALSIILEFTRATQPDDPFALQFKPQRYTLR